VLLALGDVLGQDFYVLHEVLKKMQFIFLVVFERVSVCEGGTWVQNGLCVHSELPIVDVPS